jgi:hypothetical protein
MAMAYENLAKKLEVKYHRVGARGALEDIYRLAIDVLIAEKRLEEAIKKAKTEDEKRQMEEELRKVKTLRDKVIHAYVIRTLGMIPLRRR